MNKWIQQNIPVISSVIDLSDVRFYFCATAMCFIYIKHVFSMFIYSAKEVIEIETQIHVFAISGMCYGFDPPMDCLLYFDRMDVVHRPVQARRFGTPAHSSKQFFMRIYYWSLIPLLCPGTCVKS